MTTIQTDQAARPDIIEKLTYHKYERDDMTLDDCLEYLANRWKKIPGRPERALIMQITELLAAAPQKAVAASGEPVAWANWKVGTDSYVPYRTREEAAACVKQSRIAATQDGEYKVVGLHLASTNQPVQAVPFPACTAEEDGALTILALLCTRMGIDQSLPANERAGKLSEMLPVQAKAMTDADTIAAMLAAGFEYDLSGNDISFTGGINCVRALLASQPSAQADVAAVRDAVHDFPNDVAHRYADFACDLLQALRNVNDGITSIGVAVDRAEKNMQSIRAFQESFAAPTAQPQADAKTCDHIYIMKLIDGSNVATSPAVGVCMHCGYEPQPQADGVAK